VAAPAGADGSGGGADNVVLVSTTADGSTLARGGTQVVTVAGDTVDSTNLAKAAATDCTGCHSTAVAVQVLFVTGSPHDYEPTNAAVAANGSCTGCGSYAYAWQYAIQTSGPVYLSANGQREVAELRQEIAAAAGSIVPADLDADARLTEKLDALTAELKSVIDSELQAAGMQATGAPTTHVDAHA
jgi:hypothetical protein